MATIGRVVRPHGNRGHVVVAPETDFGAERFAVGARLQTRRGDRFEELTVIASRQQAGRWIVGFEGIGSINDAETLRGCEFRIPDEALRVLGEGSYYLHDLAGCEVRLTSGVVVGTVARVDDLAGMPTLVVVQPGAPDEPDRDEVLVPFSQAFCRRVDVTEKVIDIDPPEGLIELNRRSGDR
jgi:16S rRNA processing protein RimM